MVMQNNNNGGMVDLCAALVKAQANAHAVAKESRNKFHSYDYASADDVIAAAREALSDAGLAFIPTQYSVERGTDTTEDLLNVSYELVHSSGQSFAVTSVTPVIPEKGKPMDKAVSTAKTYDLAYTLRGILLIPRVEKGAEVDNRDDRDHVPKKVAGKDRSQELDEKIEGFVALFGPEKVFAIVGKKKAELRTVEDRALAIAKLEAAQQEKVGKKNDKAAESKESASVSPDGRRHPPPKTPPPSSPLKVVPKADEAKQPGPNANQNPEATQKESTNGNAQATSHSNGSEEVFPSVDEFWKRVRAANSGTPLHKIRKEICDMFHVRDAGVISPKQRAEYLGFLEQGLAVQQ